MAQNETSDYDYTWDYDRTPGEYPETSERLTGNPKFLTSPYYNRQENSIHWRISGQRPLEVDVYKKGNLVKTFTYKKKGSRLSVECDSSKKCGDYVIEVTNPLGTAIRRFEIRREDLH